ncbi:hypothetical protein ISN44_As10g004130 [Arabidopsis suecica]|uniref:ATP-dependent RNA helicase DHX37-like C-terminal domain-containing protein n=1 Tax=Arabidopsis suecica TaxID=45249 RepID=A0A8T1ZVQ1_ARASU|nr:hypothetical protein ISN44_As10g004130 [Arabidopsis suecica]
MEKGAEREDQSRSGLPAHSVAISEDRDRAAVFGCALLQGEVLPCLNIVRVLMAGKPEMLLEREAWRLERVGSLVRVLTEKKIDSLETLRKSWEQNPNVHCAEIEAWFQRKFRHYVKELWQTMLQEAQGGLRDVRFTSDKIWTLN